MSARSIAIFYESGRSIQIEALRTLRFPKGITFSPQLPFFLIKGKFDLFVGSGIGQVNTYVTYIMSLLMRKPFVFWDEQWYWPPTKPRLLIWPLLKSVLKNASAIIVPGTKSRKFYLSITPCRAQKIFIAPNASVLACSQYYRVRADKVRERLRLRHKNVILFCGRLVKLKGIEYLIKAFAELAKSHRNTFLLVMGGPIGDGGKCNPAELENMCRSFGISNVLFLGPVYGPEKTIYFLLADVLVAPSVFDAKNSDVWGFAINEAMSLGKPVIATKAVGAAYDLIKNGVNGFIVGDKDPEALSRAIASIINNPLLKKRMGTQSLRIIRDGFTYEHMVYGFAEAIEYALRSRRSEVNTQAVRSSS